LINDWRIRMPRYVDGFVLPIPKNKLETYRAMAKRGARVWIDHGALEYRECVGEDLKVPFGVPFPKGIKSKPNETIVFAWIVYKSRKHRDSDNKKVMNDPRIQAETGPMPFDPKRMLYGGFEVMVEAQAG
jgi:uncharacterized protein YbaA (DUF1428 family)